MKLRLGMIIAFGLAAGACGTQVDDGDDKNSAGEDQASTNDSIVTDASLSEGALEASLTDAIESLSDSTDQADGNGIALASAPSRTRSCTAAGGQATVTIEGTIDRDLAFENLRRKASHSVSGSETLTRVWNKVDGEVGCSDDGKFAAIDWSQDLAGLSVAVEFQRARSIEIKHENKVNGKSFSAARSFSAKGSRTVTWQEQTESDDESTITRLKSISSSVEREHTHKNSKGDDKTVKLAVATSAEAPLVVESVRDATTLALQKKTIKSGELVASRTSDGYVKTTFADVTFTIGGAKCEMVSGTVVSDFFKSAETGQDKLVKSLKLTAAGGEYTLIDILSGDEIAEFEVPGCSKDDFAE